MLEYDGVSWRKIDTAMEIVRSLAIDDSGKIWVGGNGGFGYLEPDAAGTLHYVSLLDKVPENDRSFTDVYQTLITPQGVFFRSFELLFRWNGDKYARLAACLGLRGFRLFRLFEGPYLHRTKWNRPSGDRWRRSSEICLAAMPIRNSNKLFFHAYDDTHRSGFSSAMGCCQLYDGQKVDSVCHRKRMII